MHEHQAWFGYIFRLLDGIPSPLLNFSALCHFLGFLKRIEVKLQVINSLQHGVDVSVESYLLHWILLSPLWTILYVHRRSFIVHKYSLRVEYMKNTSPCKSLLEILLNSLAGALSDAICKLWLVKSGPPAMLYWQSISFSIFFERITVVLMQDVGYLLRIFREKKEGGGKGEKKEMR